MELLRFITCGSVDDGKSTLIGRMLYDSNTVQIDLLQAIKESSRRNSVNGLNLALLTDGLKAEREQGITIDVAYKYFNTEKRKFIIADTPGHVQYTRNMVTGASTAQLAIILVDARKGIIEQTRRHTYIAALLHLSHIVLAINKMDLVDYDKDCYEKIYNDFLTFVREFHLQFNDLVAIPINALQGDNVVNPSSHMNWYDGPCLLHHLETVEIEQDENLESLRFPVQGVLRPQSKEFHDYRGYTGQISGGIIRSGDTVQILPSGQSTRIRRIELGGKELAEAFPPMSITLLLEDDFDISRGDMLVSHQSPPLTSQNCLADLCWVNEEVLRPKARYILRHTNRQVPVIVTEIIHRVDIHKLNLEKPMDATNAKLSLNDLGRIRLGTSQPIHFDPYAKNKRTGSFILIDTATHATAGAGMLLGE